MRLANFRKMLLFILIFTVMSSITYVAYAEEDADYDWYKFSFTDENGINITAYISGLGSKSGETTEDVYAIAFEEGDTVWREYLLSGGNWSETGVIYESDPFEIMEDYTGQSELKGQMIEYYKMFYEIFKVFFLIAL